MPEKQKTKSKIRYIRLAVYLILLGLLIVTVYSQRAAIWAAAKTAQTADIGWLTAAVAVFAGSVILAATIYILLSGNRLRFALTAEVQAAGLFANKLLPAGTGALGVNFLYLRRNKFSVKSAGVIVAANNLIGLVGHVCLMIVLLMFNPDTIRQLAGGNVANATLLYWAIAVLSAGLLLLTLPTSRKWLSQKLPEFKRLTSSRQTLVACLGLSILLTACYALSLSLSAAALGVNISLAQAFVVLTFSVFAATAVPTPGGIGSAEAGAYFGLIAFGVGSELALATALLFRFVTYWLPVLVGSIAFIDITRRGLILKKL